jgi:protein-S-isoprenylcysteine O-methyltransferase Ste14
MGINAAIIVLGFWSPWVERVGIGSRIALLEWLPLQLSRTGLLRFTPGIYLAIMLAVLLAGVGALLRVWGTAYLGSGTVQGLNMRADGVMADGPYRFVRNPLYLGLWCMAAAISVMMPLAGAVFTMLLLTVFLLRLILGEEAFLLKQLGDPYRVYCASVPRLIPRLRTTVRCGMSKPHWIRGVLAELFSVGVFLTLAILSWTYDNRLMARAILISFGVSLVARALQPNTLDGKNQVTTA